MQWQRARKKAAEQVDEKYRNVGLYVAAKHAAVRKLLETNTPEEKIMRMTGISRDALKHYSRMKASDLKDTIISLSEYRLGNAKS